MTIGSYCYANEAPSSSANVMIISVTGSRAVGNSVRCVYRIIHFLIRNIGTVCKWGNFRVNISTCPPGAERDAVEPTSDISPQTGGAKPSYSHRASMVSKKGQQGRLLKEMKRDGRDTEKETEKTENKT